MGLGPNWQPVRPSNLWIWSWNSSSPFLLFNTSWSSFWVRHSVWPLAFALGQTFLLIFSGGVLDSGWGHGVASCCCGNTDDNIEFQEVKLSVNERSTRHTVREGWTTRLSRETKEGYGWILEVAGAGVYERRATYVGSIWHLYTTSCIRGKFDI
jgi:hypothetical protein